MITQAFQVKDFPRLKGAIPKKSGPRIAAGRNDLVRHFLESGADWLMMLDDDMAFEPDAIERLLQAAHPEHRPIVGGQCFAGGRDGWFSTMFRMHPETKKLTRMDRWPEGELVLVDATGAANLLIHRSVFLKLAEDYKPPWEWFQETMLEGRDVGEDITFCLRARAAGFPIFVHTGVEFGHAKMVVVDREFYEAWQSRSRFVITGTGRSGTGFMSKVLSGVGVPCYHESVYGPDGEAKWSFQRGDSSWLALPHLEAGDFDGYVLHVVREPVATINSFVGIRFFDDAMADKHGAYRQFAEVHAPEVFELSDPVERAVAWWVVWNERCAAVADATVRVEDLSGDDLVPLVRAGGAWHSPHQLTEAIAKVPTDVNSREKAELGWDDLPEGEWLGRLKVLAVGYGYDAPA
jgi:hypothetical protein